MLSSNHIIFGISLDTMRPFKCNTGLHVPEPIRAEVLPPGGWRSDVVHTPPGVTHIIGLHTYPRSVKSTWPTQALIEEPRL